MMVSHIPAYTQKSIHSSGIFPRSMMPRHQKKKNKEYYAVFKGHVDEPTIYSSWYFPLLLSEIPQERKKPDFLYFTRGDAHPRVTGCNAKLKAFYEIDEARAYLKEKKVMEPKVILKDGAGETTPLPGSKAFYAVANGRKPGIYEYD